jgi:hypothetical protein
MAEDLTPPPDFARRSRLHTRSPRPVRRGKRPRVAANTKGDTLASPPLIRQQLQVQPKRRIE